MSIASRIGLFFLLVTFLGPVSVRAENWAILIGVNEYNQATDLKYCCADQEALKKHLVEGGFDPRRVVVLGSDAKNKNLLPTHENIKRQLEINLRMVKKGDLVIFGFSGHGVKVGDEDYLCPSDADVSDVKSFIPLNYVYDSLKKSKASLKLMLVDACKNDVSLAKSVGAKAFGNDMNSIPQGILLMSSCSQGEISFEDPKFGHGVWMHFVLEALRGSADTDKDNKVTLSELVEYTEEGTYFHVRDRFNGTQIPWSKIEGQNATFKFSVAKLDYKADLARVETEDKAEEMADPAGAAPVNKTLSSSFEAELKSAMNADSIDERIKMLSLMIAGDYAPDEKKVSRKMRMKLYSIRGKKGDFVAAIADSKAIGNKGLPVVIENNLDLKYSKNKRILTNKAKKGEVVKVSSVDGDNLWVSAVNGDENRKGWVKKSRLLKGSNSTRPDKSQNIPAVNQGQSFNPAQSMNNSGGKTFGRSSGDPWIDDYIRRNNGKRPSIWQTPKWESPQEIQRLRAGGWIQ